LKCGIRQGGVPSPHLFAVFVDGIIDKIKHCGIGCYVGRSCLAVFMYADDILLLAPSVVALQKLLLLCEEEISLLDMAINASKSHCMRIGPRCNNFCANVTTRNGTVINWTDSIRYLGVFITKSSHFKCSHDSAKKSFYRSFNAIFGKVGRLASEDILVNLIRAKCLPVLLYGVDACPMNKSVLRSLDFCMNCILMKIFKTKSMEVVHECQRMFNLSPMDSAVRHRKVNFLRKFISVDNSVCKLFEENARHEQRYLLAELNALRVSNADC